MAQDKKQAPETGVEQLNENLTKVSRRLAENKKLLYWLLGAILVIGIGTFLYIAMYRNPRINKAWEAYGQVEIAAMDNDSVAAAGYAKVADGFSGTDAANVAALAAAEKFYDLGEYKKAESYLKRFSTSDDVLMSNAQALLGDCYVNLNKYDDALHAFDKAISISDRNPQVVPRMLLKKANVYDAQKKYDKALECYETITKEYPNFILNNGMSIEAYAERERARLGK